MQVEANFVAVGQSNFVDPDWSTLKCGICKSSKIIEATRYMNKKGELITVAECSKFCRMKLFDRLTPKLTCLNCHQRFSKSKGEISAYQKHTNIVYELVCSLACCKARKELCRKAAKEDGCSLIYTCKTCGKSGCTMKCSRCEVEYYCNAECQNIHWSEHKLICQPPL